MYCGVSFFLISCFFIALLKGSLSIQSTLFSLQLYTNLYILYRFLVFIALKILYKKSLKKKT